MAIKNIAPFLWYDTQAEDAAKLYVSVFANSRITHVSRYGDAGPGPKGGVMVVGFEEPKAGASRRSTAVRRSG